MSGWLPAEPEPPQEEVDWDMYLGPAAWRPFNKACSTGSISRRAAGWSAAACWSGARTAWTSASGPTAPTTPPRSSTIRPRTAWPRPLRQRREAGHSRRPAGCRWARARCGSKARRAGSRRATTATSSPARPSCWSARAPRSAATRPTIHIRDFLDCVKTRSQPMANADAACYSHIACHAANISLFLDPQGEIRSREARIHRRRAGQPPALRGAARPVAAVIWK